MGLFFAYFCLHNTHYMKTRQSLFTLIVFALKLCCCEQRQQICRLPSLSKRQYSLSAPKHRRKSASDKNFMNSKLNQSWISAACLSCWSKQARWVHTSTFSSSQGTHLSLSPDSLLLTSPTFRQFWWRFKVWVWFFFCRLLPIHLY